MLILKESKRFLHNYQRFLTSLADRLFPYPQLQSLDHENDSETSGRTGKKYRIILF